MHKMLAVFAVLSFTLFVASPAFAEDPSDRSEISGHYVTDDPFDPLIEDEAASGNVTTDGGTVPDLTTEEGGDGSGTGNGDGTGNGTGTGIDTDGDGVIDGTDADGDGVIDSGTNGDVFVNGGTDVLPNTGADPSAWIVIAYGMIAAGLAALVLARTFSSAR